MDDVGFSNGWGSGGTHFCVIVLPWLPRVASPTHLLASWLESAAVPSRLSPASPAEAVYTAA